MDFKLEVAVLPVSDVDRAKDFYKALGRREDADFVTGPEFRVVGRVTGPVPENASYGSFVPFSDPDRNQWFIQEVTTRLPGR